MMCLCVTFPSGGYPAGDTNELARERQERRERAGSPLPLKQDDPGSGTR